MSKKIDAVTIISPKRPRLTIFENDIGLKDLPSDLQYKIFELGGIRIPPDLLRRSLSGFRLKYYNYEIEKSHRYFLQIADSSSPTALAWKRVMQNSDEVDIPSINSKIKTIGFALKILSEGLSTNEKNEINNSWGPYSLNLQKIKVIEQYVTNRSLRFFFHGIKQNLRLPDTFSEDEFRKWLDNSKNETAIRNVRTIKITNTSELEASNTIPMEITKFKSVTQLKISESNIHNILPLEFLTDLTFLDVSNNFINDLRPLTPLINLTHLELNYNRINSILPLGSLTSLTHLCIGSNKIIDGSPLATLTHLTHLNIKNNQIAEILFLRTLINLTHLTLSRNQVSDISPLRFVTSIIYLNLSSNQINDISPLTSLTELVYLNLNNNLLNDISPLSPLIQLIDLELSTNEIRNLHPLNNLSFLNNLFLSNNEITDISPLKNIGGNWLDLSYNQIKTIYSKEITENFKYIDLSSNEINECADISKNTKCIEINLSNNYFKNLDFLKKFDSLKKLNLQGCTLFDGLGIFPSSKNDLESIKHLENLEELILDNNLLNDLKPLTNLKRLIKLSLSHNSIENPDPLRFLTNLTSLKLNNNLIADLTFIRYLRALEELYISKNPIVNLEFINLFPNIKKTDIDLINQN